MSVSIKAQITPQVLVWARDSAGFSQEDIAGKFRQKSATIDAWEHGRAQPTYVQLEKLAKIYKRPIAIFFFPVPPEDPSSSKKLRSLPDTFSKSLPPEIRYLVRLALAKQADLSDIHGENTPSDIEIFKSKTADMPRNDPRALAVAMRKFFMVSLNEQFEWKAEDDALKHWRNKLENAGIWIFKDAFKTDDYCGFCLYDEKFPIIYLNNSMPKSRQIFTLFHEMGHLLIAKGGFDFRDDVESKFTGIYRNEEIFCNAFAGAFLVPDDNFPLDTEPTDNQISNNAKRYKVSREVILRRCLDRRLVTKEFYNSKVEDWRENWESREGNNNENTGGGDYYANQKTYLGDKYLNLLFSEYYRQRIDEYKLADYLGVKIASIQTLEGRMLKGDR